ncbi:hypothetical protein BKP43_20270 [Variovorax boronicumulans]|uniref:DUF1254 domain-containing protein n=1 Tax=Variovorax boronicumulans TaxID=436515 RepID=UPI000BB3A79F|nr:DUF1254 domain-containing protein [Variovorax boronicumulans]PBI92090.1 hypothetical protein BKP43_20270 [Variovorax boronicumulans]
MNAPVPVPDIAAARKALARSIGLAAFVYGYPLTETYRTCAMQTAPRAERRSGASAGSDVRAPLNTLHHAPRPSTHEDRDVVTPANDLLYTMAWLHLAHGPMLLTVPASARHPGRYFVLPLYDAYTENFENLGPRNCNPEGETVVLVGPGGTVPESLAAAHRVVRCPTDLVWLIGRILVGDESDWPAARALQSEIQLTPAPGTVLQGRPAAIEQWAGPHEDAMAAAFEHGEPAAEVAPRFFTNVCHALAEAPGRVEDRALVAWFGQGGLLANAAFSWDALEAPLREGLIEGFAEGVQLVGAVGRNRRPKPWSMTPATGRYGNEFLGRARTAYLGLGALATSEAVYAAAHHDATQEPLDGQRRYTMRFEAGDLPPADAFWSVTLYDSDRFLYPNDIRRHAIGDRTPGLKRNADGSLELVVSHARPTDAANWLPAPAGRFYLILRMYYPREGVQSWRIPALQAQQG